MPGCDKAVKPLDGRAELGMTRIGGEEESMRVDVDKEEDEEKGEFERLHHSDGCRQ